MKESIKFPPNYSLIVKNFPNLQEHKPLFCYGDTIYNPFERNVTPDLVVHEEVHSKQQGNLPDVWWDNYFNDPIFRLAQELEAYGTQYAFIKKHMRGKLLAWGLDKMGEALSSDLYGNLISYGSACSQIKKFAKDMV